MYSDEKKFPMVDFITKIPWAVVIVLCLTLGLTPYAPPHIVEKLQMLLKGQLVRPIDWFDLVFHGIPWILLILKVVFTIGR